MQSKDGYGATGKTTAEMKTQSTFTDASWDFTTTWAMSSDIAFGGYPTLQWTGGYAVAPTSNQIATLQNLVWVAENSSRWSDSYTQTADINAWTTASWDGNQGWTPIGNSSTYFTGYYDGQNYAVSNLYINRSSSDNVGMFGFVNTSGDAVKNLGVINVNITGQGYVGGLVGQVSNAVIIEDCYATGSVSGSSSFVGGFVGFNYGNIRSCYATVSVTGSSNWVGGFVGQSNGTIENSYATGNVTGSGNNVGGFVGIGDNSIINCYATGTVSGSGNYVGGFIGYSTSDGTIQNCYAKGGVTRSSGSGTYYGGFCGQNFRGKILKSYSTGSVKYGTTTQTNKGFCGAIDNGGNYEMSGNFWDTETSGATSTADPAGSATGKTTAEMTTDALAYNYTTNIYLAAGWDFKGEATNGTNEIWNIGNSRNDGYPYLDWQYPEDDASLPVELTAFTAKSQSGAVILSWTTESETENLGFILEKRLQVTGNWLPVADYRTVKALQGYGSTSEKHEYQYTDQAVQQGVTYLYRLGDVDYSGKLTWHKEVEVKVEAEDVQLLAQYHLRPIYPNPFNASFTIPLELGVDLPVDVRLYDVNGACVRTILNEVLSAGTYHLTTNTHELASGIYLLRVRIGNQTEMQKIMLMK